MQTIIHGDCLDEMMEIPEESIDMILCDLPYGITACKRDTVIPFIPLWEHYNRIIKDNGAIVLFGSEPFSSALRMSNIKNYKYDWVWEKQKASNFIGAKHQPLKHHEIISVFNVKGYNPQKYNVIEIEDILSMTKKQLVDYHKNRNFDNFGVVDKRKNVNNETSNKELIGSDITRIRNKDDGTRFPKSIIKINKEARNVHPTQKPVALFEYLIKTYTNEGDLVLDNCAGSFTTAIASENLKRNWICIEKEEEYCDIGRKRITENRERLRILDNKINK